MFKKFKDRLAEVGEEVKKDPRFVNSIASVNQLAHQTYSAISKNEQSGSRESLPSGFPPGPGGNHPLGDLDNGSSGHRRTFSDQYLQTLTDFSGHHSNTNNGSKDINDSANMAVANSSFFSLTEEDDLILPSPQHSPLKEQDLGRGASPGPRSRRLSSGSMISEAANLFPIYETTPQLFSVPSSDLDSTAGSEWEADDYAGSSSHLSAISKEQLFQMLQKTRTRYHKYKGRCSDVMKAYNELQSENAKVKNVMQQTQDKALRRISELREQCQLEQSAKRHLEEELRSDMEEKEHIIKALQTKVALLREGRASSDDRSLKSEDADGNLVDLSDSPTTSQHDSLNLKPEPEKVAALEDKVKRLEALLTKCKESIKANKQKTVALTEVKESLATQLANKETECKGLGLQLSVIQGELDVLKKKEQEEELQMAESKMVMHQEIINKDEEISKLRSSLKKVKEEGDKLKEEVDSLKKSQELLESDKSSALSEMSRVKAGAVQALKDEMERKIEEIKESNDREKKEMREMYEKEKKVLKAQWEENTSEKLSASQKDKQRELKLRETEFQKRLEEKDEEGRLAREELELRVQALLNSDESKTKLLRDLEARLQSSTSDSSKIGQLSESLKKKEIELTNIGEEKAIIDGKLQQALEELSKFGQISEDLAARQIELENLGKENQLLQEKINSSVSDSSNFEKMSENLRVKESKLAELEEANSKLEMQSKSLEERVAELTINLDKVFQDLKESQAKDDERVSKIEALTSSNEQSSANLQDLESKLVNLLDQVNEKSQLIEILKKDHQANLKKMREDIQNEGNNSATQMQKEFEDKLSSLKEDHKVVLGKFSQKLKEANTKVKEGNANTKDLNQGLEQERKEVENLNKKLEEMTSQLTEKDDSLSKLREEHQSSLRLFQDQLQSAGNDVTTQLQINFEAQCSALKQEHQVEVSKLSDILKSLQDQIENEKEQNKILASKLLESTKNAESLETARLELEDNLEKLKLEAQTHLERLSSLTEELRLKAIELDETRDKLSRSDLEIETRAEELTNVSREVESLRKCLSDSETKHCEIVKELQLSHDREKAQKGLKDQMISYQKELQEQIRAGKLKEETFRKKIEDLEQALEERSREVHKLSEQKNFEIKALKNDLELKIRLEREKEISFKEHQLQSIEYQKKLQEQLQEAARKVEEAHSALQTARKEHLKEVERASLRVDQLSTEVERLSTEMTKLASERDNYLEQVDSLTLDLEQSQISLAKATFKLEESEVLKSTSEVMVLELSDLKTQNKENEAKILSLLSEVASARSELKAGTDQLEQLQMQKQELSSQLDHARQLQAEHEVNSDKVKHLISDLKTGKETLELQLRQLEKEKEEASIRIQDLKVTVQSSQVQNQEHSEEWVNKLRLAEEAYKEKESLFLQEKESLEASIGDLNAKIVQLEEEFIQRIAQDAERQVEQKSLILEAEERVRVVLQSKNNLLTEENERLDSSISEALAKIAHLENQVRRLEEQQQQREEECLSEMSETKEIIQELKHVVKTKEADLLELSLRLQDAEELNEGLRKELKSSQADKEAQLLEFEESLESLERQVSELKKRNDELEADNDRRGRKEDETASLLASQRQQQDQQESRLKAVLREAETRLAQLEQDQENEIENLRQKSREEMEATVRDFRSQVAELKQELYEKTSIYDEMVECHKRELAAKQEEMDQEVEACNRVYQTRLAELEAAQEAKWTELEKNETSQNSWHWERQQDPRNDIVQRTPTREQLVRSPATLNITSNNHQTNHCNHNHSLEEATEYEYLKNILYQYMIGKEPTTLSKVLSAVVKFSPEQQKEIGIREEHKQSFLTSLGFKPL